MILNIKTKKEEILDNIFYSPEDVKKANNKRLGNELEIVLNDTQAKVVISNSMDKTKKESVIIDINDIIKIRELFSNISDF